MNTFIQGRASFTCTKSAPQITDNVEGVDKFCHVADKFPSEGGSYHATVNGVGKPWSKFSFD
jgi:hypothetical protein